ncbi:glycoside hydrolase TIM-barrel-like domain-containing protein [Methylocystis sp. MJC1]|uniref:baseplate megatron protein TIM-barrel domain-containing protein n=1 Tax=Methylocystis sp. MJC1 TaxID=2654282 RepID=UPI0013E9C081|nr:glycoside hydrolase TIM-barrel-like domain-containing protein [Methylocystis sp. MJC1]KAF2991161.1 hypothetical protein MJC1_01894 [Methylocystis sp. MJC1]MBU6525916.1 glycoside hydrolase TIM-barrel-like domain-containing protein [Methylocystis sp. MJC1]UZX12382.1 glycoside hydrolase TIM-barrel-like domain-containing protein [Methylocystis sp. MJC1]
MSFPWIGAINVIPSSGEFTYDTVPYTARQPGASAFLPINTYYAPGGTKTDFEYALDQLQADLPNCQFVALVIQWMGNSLDASACQVYPSTTYWLGTQVGAFAPADGTSDAGLAPSYWRVSGLTLADCNNGLIPISRPDGVNSAYGGTCSDQSVVRAIQAVKARGLKVALYVQMNMDVTGQPWRGMCVYSSDMSTAADAAVAHFLGTATTAMFTRDAANLTVNYSNSGLPSNGKYDFTFRRFILHYANLAVVAGGVNLFCINGELRGLEMIRGSTWTPQGTVDGSGKNHWNYPFVTGLVTLANDIRIIFDGAGLAKNLAARQNLITYSPDWSQWTGAPHSGTYGGQPYNGVWPHLDDLYSAANIDLVSFDNYFPLSDWTTGDGGLDALNWRGTPPSSWPVASPNTIGLGLAGAPDIHSIAYLQSQIEGGEKFNYWYGDYNSSKAYDPNGTLQIVTAPQGDRLTQSRNAYAAGQELLALKKVRWWWSNQHKAVYDNGDGQGWIPRGNPTSWVPYAKSIMHMEYGSPCNDKCTNEPNLFFDLGSVAGGTQFWTVWRPDGSAPKIDNAQCINYHQAFNAYWQANNWTVGSVPMMATDMMFAWNWDARPFPTFPLRLDIWADGKNWANSHWLNGKFPGVASPAQPSPPAMPALATFPSLPGLAWSAVMRPKFATQTHDHASGKSSRRAKMVYPLYEIELTYEFLRADSAGELQALLGFFKQQQGQTQPFWFAFPNLSNVTGAQIGTGDGSTKTFFVSYPFGQMATPAPGKIAIAAVYVNGIAQASGAWSKSTGGPAAVTLSTAPALGAIVSIDATITWICRFSDDTEDLEQFTYNLFDLKSLKLQTVKDWGSVAFAA